MHVAWHSPLIVAIGRAVPIAVDYRRRLYTTQSHRVQHHAQRPHKLWDLTSNGFFGDNRLSNHKQGTSMSDLCEQICDMVREGLSPRHIARELDIPVQWVYEALELQDE
jgi:hypothetical protein